MEKLIGYFKVPVYIGDDGKFYTKDFVSDEIVPEEEED